jgi:hypothetical protein
VENECRMYGFEIEGKPLECNRNIWVLPDTDYIAEEIINQRISEYNERKDKELKIKGSELHETFENSLTTNISVDEVCVKEQKETNRVKNPIKKPRGSISGILLLLYNVRKRNIY